MFRESGALSERNVPLIGRYNSICFVRLKLEKSSKNIFSCIQYLVLTILRIFFISKL